MTQHKIPMKCYEVYENLISSLNTENDLNDIVLENLTHTRDTQINEEDPKIYKLTIRSNNNLTYESISYNLRRPSQTSLISEQLRNLRRKFSDRTDAIKEIIHQPPDYDHDKSSTTVTVREELQQKQFPHRSIFASESISHASTPSLAPEVNEIKQRLQRILLRCIRKSGIRKPIDTDSKLKIK
ncbi:unnamed protein product [Adineta steineri]|uniref:Uncharacterized protein n=1 Tax=Adineta steineri TaxID=433720 RepID=A0A819TQC4_9BILA|nr:unnamed protein product [Adineta steineri]CAF4083461.1 unnamed protein product [Adineta steineri]CAF4144508.1 unnamed protein product [Adineta steineri]